MHRNEIEYQGIRNRIIDIREPDQKANNLNLLFTLWTEAIGVAEEKSITFITSEIAGHRFSNMDLMP